MAEIIMTRHARLAAERRGLTRGAIRRAVLSPNEVKPGNRQGAERRVSADGVCAVVVTERRWLRVLTVYRDGLDDPYSESIQD